MTQNFFTFELVVFRNFTKLGFLLFQAVYNDYFTQYDHLDSKNVFNHYFHILSAQNRVKLVYRLSLDINENSNEYLSKRAYAYSFSFLNLITQLAPNIKLCKLQILRVFIYLKFFDES